MRTPRDKAALLRMLDNIMGGDPETELPLASLQELTKHVAALSRKQPPRLVQQKRQFVRGWYEDEMKLQGSPLVGSHDHSTAGSPAAPRYIDPATLFAEVDARLAAAQRSITQAELSDMHVDTLSEQISALLGAPVPTMMRDRRNLIRTWHAEQKQHAMGGAMGYMDMGRGAPPIATNHSW
jgi:hypothetical protein